MRKIKILYTLLLASIIFLIVMFNLSIHIFNIYDAWIGIILGAVSIPLLIIYIFYLIYKIKNK